jgi:glycosyltransferase involved in cell wall biosynthesis
MAEKSEIASRPRVSACIITLDEEERIADCIRSVSWCDEVVVVDAHSRDRTREIAVELGARVIESDWPGHVAQKEFAVRAAQHDWVFCIDADERVSPLLRDEITALRDSGFPGSAGWRMPRMSCYLGRWIRHGTWYPDWSLRLFDRRRGHWGGNDPHDRVELDGRRGTLRGVLLHHPYRNLSEHLRTIDSYTTIMAQGLHQRGRRARVSDLVFRPGVRFFRFYFLKAGFLEGWRGLLLAYLAAHYVRLKYAKLLVLQKQSPPPAEK